MRPTLSRTAQGGWAYASVPPPEGRSFHVIYYYGVHPLAQRVLSSIRRQGLMRPGDRVGVAVSGGADSVALLRLLLELRDELGIVLSVVHFNHKLRGADSDADQAFVATLAREHKLELHGDAADVSAYSAAHHLSVEAAARRLRYQFFRRLLHHSVLDRIATAHTLDDQAETVLLRLLRGAGTRGLAGIYPRLRVSSAAIVRPLLEFRRGELEDYLRGRGQGWREDTSNRDLRYTRNRIRHGILPRLERHVNPSVRRALAEAAEIARAEEEYWAAELERLLPQVWRAAEQAGGRGRTPTQPFPGGTLDLDVLARQPIALQRRLVRAAAESLGLRLEFRHGEHILRLAADPFPSGAAKSLALPDGWVLLRRGRELVFEKAEKKRRASHYEYPLPVPGRVRVAETGSVVEARLVAPATVEQGYNPEQLLNPRSLAGELLVRNWRPGDRFWPAHTKSPKKVKELLQQRHIRQPERQLWPVVASGETIVWMRGFAAPAQMLAAQGWARAVLIQELPGEASDA